MAFPKTQPSHVIKLFAAVSISCLAACAGNSDNGNLPVTATDDGSEQSASPSGPMSAPSLADLENYTADNSGPSAKEQARLADVQQAALTFGLQGGLAHGSAIIDKIVRAHSAFLTRTYDFGALTISAPYGVKILPPVIVESDSIYDQVSASEVVIAAKRYHILYPATPAPVQPLWQSYLLVEWSTPANPDPAYLPNNELERKAWNDSLKKGFEVGERQALSVFKINLNRLQREYLGMVRWSNLVATGQATVPIVTSEMKPVVGGGNTVTINQGKVDIVSNTTLLPRTAQ